MSLADLIMEKLNYHTEKHSNKNAIAYLKKINPKLDENNYLTYAYLATNPEISEEERNHYMNRMRELYNETEQELEMIKRIKENRTIEYIDDNDIHRQQDNNTHEQLSISEKE
jgi:hypothetical protein